MNIFLQITFLLLIYYSILFVIGVRCKKHSIVDIAWGFGFVIIGIYTYIMSPEQNLRSTIVTVLTLLWGIRLSYHIGKRNIGKPEDFRYIQLAKKWGTRWVVLKAFLHVYLLQLIILYLVALPVIIINTYSETSFKLLDYIGITVWIVGYLFEVIGDYQLKDFKSNDNNKGKIIKIGLWRYTRHPNYFGESVMWIGIYILSLSVKFGIYTIISPVLITYLLIYVSGVAMLEKKYDNNKEYKQYKNETNAFFPWFVKVKK